MHAVRFDLVLGVEIPAAPAFSILWGSFTQVPTEPTDRAFVTLGFERVEHMPRAGGDHKFVRLAASLQCGGKLQRVRSPTLKSIASAAAPIEQFLIVPHWSARDGPERAWDLDISPSTMPHTAAFD